MGVLISTCYVVVTEIGGLLSVDTTIYLSLPKRDALTSTSKIYEFENVFVAREFIRQNTLGAVRVQVAG